MYIIGSEVPVPGGANETRHELMVTTSKAVHATIEVHRLAFAHRGLQDAWDRVIGLAVQPGVEFDHDKVIDYQPLKTTLLNRSIVSVPGMVFAALSTDYQTPGALADLVRDHFAILKVGPAVSFALREGFWALAAIAAELGLGVRESLKKALLEEMQRDPKYWKTCYQYPARQQFDMQFSLSDRIRYYWGTPNVTLECAGLMDKLTAIGIPQTLFSQYMPLQFAAYRDGQLNNDPRVLELDSVAQVLRGYARDYVSAAPLDNAYIHRDKE